MLLLTYSQSNSLGTILDMVCMHNEVKWEKVSLLPMNLLLVVMKSFSETILQISPNVSLARVASHALSHTTDKENAMTTLTK